MNLSFYFKKNRWIILVLDHENYIKEEKVKTKHYFVALTGPHSFDDGLGPKPKRERLKKIHLTLEVGDFVRWSYRERERERERGVWREEWRRQIAKTRSDLREWLLGLAARTPKTFSALFGLLMLQPPLISRSLHYSCFFHSLSLFS